jgi:putative membrane protein
MIKNFGDHAANERTFLAWVRTAIAVMALGFLSRIAAPSLAGRTLPGQKNSATLPDLHLSLLARRRWRVAASRFFTTARMIDRKELRASPGSRIDLVLAALLILLGCALFIYLSHALVTKL